MTDLINTLPPALRKQRLRSDEAAAYLAVAHGVTVAPATLNKLRSTGGGPVFEKFGRSVFYPRAGLDDWIASRLSAPKSSTSDAARAARPAAPPASGPIAASRQS